MPCPSLQTSKLEISRVNLFTEHYLYFLLLPLFTYKFQNHFFLKFCYLGVADCVQIFFSFFFSFFLVVSIVVCFFKTVHSSLVVQIIEIYTIPYSIWAKDLLVISILCFRQEWLLQAPLQT